MSDTVQTTTPFLGLYHALENEQRKLRDELIGKRLDQVRTPSLVVDRTVVQRNCNRLGLVPSNVKVRCHVKSHKTIELAEMQLDGAKSDAIVVSTLPEAHFMVNSDLVLLGFPVTPDKFSDIFHLSTRIKQFQIFIETLEALESYHSAVYGLDDIDHRVGVFIKVDCGYGRAGVPLNSQKERSNIIQLAQRLAVSRVCRLEGLYSHAGHSYNARTAEETMRYLEQECQSARDFQAFFKHEAGVDIPYVSIGATPTVGALMHDPDRACRALQGINEVHAGNYCILDRQQVATGLWSYDNVGMTVLARVSSLYPDRGTVLLDAGALALSKDTSPQGGFGVLAHDPNVVLRSISQEHGILETGPETSLRVGQVVRVIPNHCCLASACHLYYLIIENGDDRVVDIWFPVRGW
ncbi:putative serine dehydratase domain-containing protein [Dichotomocladium elegans]|nr:putative serine dehydratase domain-containing protein [Dichotomocladium elegans]